MGRSAHRPCRQLLELPMRRILWHYADAMPVCICVRVLRNRSQDLRRNTRRPRLLRYSVPEKDIEQAPFPSAYISLSEDRACPALRSPSGIWLCKLDSSDSLLLGTSLRLVMRAQTGYNLDRRSIAPATRGVTSSALSFWRGGHPLEAERMMIISYLATLSGT